MFRFAWISIFVYICAANHFGSISANGLDPNNPNVCEKIETFEVDAQVKIPVPYNKTEYEFCYRLPLMRCKKERTFYRETLRLEKRIQNRTVFTCCDGYHQAANSCIPVCVNQCIHGQCIRPETCECQPGYGGNTCNISCPEGKWGSQCEQTCLCSNNARCNPVDGRCSCLPGTWGPGCANVCTCRNGACDSLTGACTCTPGFIGKNCEHFCPDGTYGPHCASRCSCQANQTETCRNTDGFCICRPGYNGLLCENPCPFGSYGLYCESTCRCSSSAYFCDPVIGCVCKSNPGSTECVEVILSQSFRSDVESSLYHRSQSPYSVWIAVLLLITTGCCFLLYHYKRQVSKLKNDIYVMYLRTGGTSMNNPIYDENETAVIGSKLQQVPSPNVLFSQSSRPPAYTEHYERSTEPIKHSIVNPFDSEFQPSIASASSFNGPAACSNDWNTLKRDLHQNEPSTSRANPNVYTSIDEVKGAFNVNKEPVYDEIAQKSDSPKFNHNLMGNQIASPSIGRFDSDDSINESITNTLDRQRSVESDVKPFASDNLDFSSNFQVLHYDTPRQMDNLSASVNADPFAHYETLSTAETLKADFVDLIKNKPNSSSADVWK